MILTIARPMSSRFHLGLAVFCIHLLAATSWSQATLHILIAADTTAEDDVGKSCTTDLNNIKEFFSEPSNIAANRRTITYLTGAPPPETAAGAGDFSAKAILDIYRKAKQNGDIKPEVDTVFFCYLGHGAFDKDKGHYFNTPDRVLLRSEVRSAILECRPRLAVIVSDCCQALKNLPAVVQPRERIQDRAPVVDCLFFRPSGIVNINSCSEGQVAGGDPDDGGYLISSFLDQMNATVGQIEQRAAEITVPLKRDGILKWSEFFPLLKIQTNGRFKRAYPKCLEDEDLKDLLRGGKQCTQDPQAFDPFPN